MPKRPITETEARRIGAQLGITWGEIAPGTIEPGHIDPEQFRRGLEVEFEHGSRDQETNVTNDDPILTGKIAWAHLKEFPDYYARLDRLEAEADAYWTARR